MINIRNNRISYTSVIALCSFSLLALTPMLTVDSKTDLEVSAVEEATSTTLDDNKAHAAKFYEIWNAHTPDALDTVIADDYKMHSSLPGVNPDREGMKQWVATVIAAFPDIHFTIEQQIAEDDLVMTRWSATGTHKGALMGMPATGRKTRVTGISIVRLKNGLSIESWGEWDALGMIKQIEKKPAGN